MYFGIISAGEGSRLALEGAKVPKPLTPLAGKPMIGRLIDIMRHCGADGISVIVNPVNRPTIEYLKSLRIECPLTVIEKATESSMHSFYELSSSLKGERFCVTTVDTVFREDEFEQYIRLFETCDADAVMGVTEYVDDERPLYVGVSDDMRIYGFYDEPNGCKYVSGGIYGLCRCALSTLEHCVSSGQARMRSFQRQMVADGLRMTAYRFGKIVDVDHLSDIRKAEDLLKY